MRCPSAVDHAAVEVHEFDYCEMVYRNALGGQMESYHAWRVEDFASWDSSSTTRGMSLAPLTATVESSARLISSILYTCRWCNVPTSCGASWRRAAENH